MTPMDVLSDCVWKYLGVIAAGEQPHMTVTEVMRAVEEQDRGFVMEMLKTAELHGLAERGRTGVSAPFQWTVTSKGRTELAGRAA